MRKTSKPRRLLRVLAVAFLTTLVCASGVHAQPPPGVLASRIRGEAKQVPSGRYYAGVAYIQAGQYANAVRFYNTELKNATKIGTSLWIDSICYYAMLGETYYQSGNFDEALRHFNSGLTIAMAYPNWLSQVTYTSGVSGRVKGATPWGVSRRNSPLGVFPNKATIVVGEGESEASRQLGITMEQHAMSIDPIEILRCIALSIRRRIDIIGPLAPYDPMSAEILDTFRTRAVAPNHWSVVFLDVIWGLALEQSDKTSSAVKTFNDSLMAMGQFDHTLTGVALLELGHIFLKSNKIREAAECYYEASLSAFQYGDLLLLEEALRDYSNCAKALRGGAADPALAGAYRWAKSQRGLTVMQVSLGLELVEDMIYSGKIPQAKSGLAALDTTMRGEIRRSCHADRWNYLNALLNYATGNMNKGDEALALVVEGAKVHSTWARQLRKLDAIVQHGLTATGALTPRNAADLYEYLLREPTVVDWAVNPTDSLSIQMIAPIGAYERHFRLLIDRDLKDKAFEVSERIRRERFFSTQTYGGRLVSLRYIMTAENAVTTASMRAARESLTVEYPDFGDSLKATSEIMQRLNALPTVPNNRDDAKTQEALFAELMKVAARQEALLRFIAAGRVRIPYVFPPVYTVEEVQKRMPLDTAILSFIDAEGDLYGFMIGKENLDAWRVGPTDAVGAAVSIFLKTIGNADGSRVVEAEQLNDDSWKVQGSRLREIVLGATDVEADRFNIVFSKLVVVPDATIWYLPFEALCLPKSASSATDDELNDSDATNEFETTRPDDESESEPGAIEIQTQEERNAAEAAAREDQYDDLDVGYYYDDDDEEPDVRDSVGSLPEKEDSDELDGTSDFEALDEAEDFDAPVGDADDAEPTKRLSKKARERAALEAYADSVMPMIAAPDFTIRYSATVSLALPNAIGRNAFVETTLIAGATFPRESVELVDNAVTRFSAAVPRTETARAKDMYAIPGSLYSSRLRRLVVWEEVIADTWNWSPLVLGSRSRIGNTVSAWIEAPWGAPRLLVMPALRTPAENALKNGGMGNEIALAVLAMQASGGDTMLLSRWRTGGRSAYDLSQSFVENYEKSPAANAWKDAVNALRTRDVVVDEEPRLKKLGRSESIPKYSAPFWWAGYILVDSGERVDEEQLEEFDEDAERKAEEENALLHDDNAQQQGELEDIDFGDGGEGYEDEEDHPVFVTPRDESELPFSAGPRPITDEELAARDEEGDDFFAPRDDPEEITVDEPEPQPQAEEEAEEETEPQSDSNDGNQSAGRLTIKGKGR